MKSRIEIHPAVHFGKPCVAGTRIPVVDVLELVNKGIAFFEIIKNYYPDINENDIRACIRYAINIMNAEDIKVTVKE